MAKPTPIDQPTRTSVAQFFRDLRYRGVNAYDAVAPIREELENLKAALIDTPAVRKLQARHDKAYADHKKRHEYLRDRIDRVHKLFLTQGLTPKVQKELNKLVDELNNEA